MEEIMRWRGGVIWTAIIVSVFLLASGPARAATISITGSLDNPNAVFLYEFELAAASDLLVESFGYGGGTNGEGAVIPAGGFDAYVSLFRGWGDGATFLASSDDEDYGSGLLDPWLAIPGLSAGNYTLGVTVAPNMSFAENYGDGTLGDGFIALWVTEDGLGGYRNFTWDELGRTADFALDITWTDEPAPVPEPATILLTALGLLGLASSRRRKAR
jgi:hypothetical protein